MRNDKWVKRWVVPSSSGDGKYIIGQDAEGTWGCSCRGWTSHTPRTDCKHIRLVKAGGGLTYTDAVLDALTGG